jgi:hypothetical protein
MAVAAATGFGATAESLAGESDAVFVEVRFAK